MFQLFHVESKINFFTVAAENKVAAIQACAIRERVAMLDLVMAKAVTGVFVPNAGIIGQEAA